jgi:hypothetical protein
MNDLKFTTAGEYMDSRCCGSDACVIDSDGKCWCGQKWDGEKMCYPVVESSQCSPP